MIYSGVSKHVEFSCDELDMHDEFDLEIPIQEDFNDILSYYFEKKYEVPYTETSWVLEKGAREFVCDLEDKWLHNEIDTFALYHDRDFLNFLERKDLNTGFTVLDEELERNYRDFVWECESEARSMSKASLKDLIDEKCGSAYIEAYIDDEPQDFIEDSIDLEEIYEEEYGDDEEEDED